MLENKIIVLTGGGGGIGWECAKAYVKAGATVCILDKNQLSNDKLEKLKSKDTLALICNLANEAEVADAFNTIIDKYGRIDAIHNNAAIAHPSKTLDQTSNPEWDLLMDINLKSILFTTR